MNDNGLNTLLSQLKGQRVLIFPHISPDGDTIGSAIGMRHLLLEKGVEGIIVLNDDVPLNLSFLTNKLPVGAMIKGGAVDFQYEYVFAVDCAEPKLFSDRDTLIGEGVKLINIDHHHTNKKYGLVSIVDVEASSTGELIYSLIEDLGIALDELSAEALYTAIVTDTGSFRYSNTRPYTFKACSKLIEYPFDFNALNVELFQNKPFEKVELLNRVFNTLKRFEEGKVAFAKLDQHLKAELNYEDYDTDGIVEYIRDIQGVEVVVFLKATDDGKVKGSLRAKNDFDVSRISQLFGGGGHIKAAGFTSTLHMDELEAQIIKAICEQMR